MEFYYSKILKIKEVDEVEETVAANTMGTVLHEALEYLYKPFIGQILREKDLREVLPLIGETTKKYFKNNYKNGDVSKGKNKLIFEVVVNFIERFIHQEIQEIKKGSIIRIIALEQKFREEIKFPAFDFPIIIGGTVDRIDEVDSVLRIVDYKSGMVSPGQLNLDFFDKITDYKYSKGMQLMLYAYLYITNNKFDYQQELQAGIISFKNLNYGFMPVKFTKKDNRINVSRIEDFMLAIQDLFIEIFNIEIPFEAVER
jgi:ATP-dependent helicase/DNAse subunit B